MSRKIFFVSYLPNPSGDAPATYYIFDGKNYAVKDNFAEFANAEDVLISFDWDNLITWLSIRKQPFPVRLLDIEQISKQIFGHKNLQGQPLPWSVWTIVSNFYTPEENKDFVKAKRVYQGLDAVDDKLRSRLFFRLLTAMAQAFEKQLEALKSMGEYHRFKQVERRIREINLERTYKGIAIDTDNVARWVDELSQTVYSLRNALQLQYGVMSPADWVTVRGKIEDRTSILDAQRIIEEKGYYFFLKDAKQRHPLIQLLYDEKKSSTDLNVLLTIGALRPSFKIIRPVYDSFGTITARTKIVTPNLQNLSKRFRTIIAPAAGKTLIYIDYAQFEAGILAQDSGDTLLISEYNAKYIYAEIGNRIEIQKFLPNIEDQKKFCKSLFYKFSYGMDISQHIQILKDFKLESHAAALSPKIIKAFASYSSLNMYRMKINEELLSQRKIGTFDGNYRYLFENEQRTSWAISQRIQGTASLILKKAIIELYDNDKEIEFLIPMHDAALFQVPQDKEDQKKALIKAVFEQAFKCECPNINPSAKFKAFHDS